MSEDRARPLVDVTTAALRFAGEPSSLDLTEHLQLALQASRLGTWRWDMTSGRVDWDARLEEIYGFEPGEFPGTFEAYQERLHPDDRPRMMAAIKRATETHEAYQLEHRVVWPDGTVRWVQGSGRVTVDAAGEVNGAIGCSMDVTDLMEARVALASAATDAQAAAQRERANRQRLEFLVQMGEVLADAATGRDVMAKVARATVPRLGDWCLMYVLDPEAPATPWVEVAHTDPELEARGRGLVEALPWDPDAPTGAAAVIRTGEPIFLPDLTEEALAAMGLPEERRELIRSFGFRSVLGVPLIKRHRILGALMYVMAESDRHFTDDDLPLALAMASRVASALENRRLSDQQRVIAQTLQRSLLPERLPEVDGVDVAVRYWAAGEATEVGGDFYDLFLARDGVWAAVIGDVCGTGPAAAAITSPARHTTRLCTWRGDDPGTVLRWLNQALIAHEADTFLTAAYVLLRPTGSGIELSITCAGHPLPVIGRADGSARAVGQPGTLLGCFPEPRLHTVEARVELGETMVLYTDGVCDVPPPHLLSEQDVREIVASSAADASGPDAVVDAVESRLSSILAFEHRDDDIALLALQPRASGGD